MVDNILTVVLSICTFLLAWEYIKKSNIGFIA